MTTLLLPVVTSHARVAPMSAPGAPATALTVWPVFWSPQSWAKEGAWVTGSATRAAWMVWSASA